MFIYLWGVKLQKKNKVDVIFSATLKLVLQMGIAGITMRQIAKEAGIATGTLYIYFKDKETLVNELFNKCRTAALDTYFRGYNKEDAFEISFEKIWHNMLNHRVANFEEAVFLEQCFHSPFITETTKEMSSKVLQPLLKFMERGKLEERIKDEDTLLLIIFMIGSVSELIKFTSYWGRALNKPMTNAAFKICWDGIKR